MAKTKAAIARRNNARKAMEHSRNHKRAAEKRLQNEANDCNICNKLETRPWHYSGGDFESDRKPEIGGGAYVGMEVDDMEEDEVPVPVKQLTNQRTRCRVLDTNCEEIGDIGVTGVPHRIPLAPTVCFVCITQLRCIHRQYSLAAQPCRSDYMLLFTEILKIPENEAVKYLENFEQPQEWMGLCKLCKELLVDAKRVKKEICELEARLQNCQKDVLIKMKGSLDVRSKFTLPQGSDQKDKCVTMIAIWEHVRSSNYDILDDLMREAFNEDVKVEPERMSSSKSYKPRSSASTMIHLPYSEINDERIFVDEDDEMDSSNVIEDKKEDVFYCGLCDDEQSFSAKGLISHTNQVHQLPSTSSSQEPKGKAPFTSQYDPPPTSFRYDCPNCPEVKVYTVGRYAQHLIIHQRRPYRCTICLQLFPDEDDLHWAEKHGDVEEHSDKRFIKLNLNPGEIWKCLGCHSGFLTERKRHAHELNCPFKSSKFSNSKNHQCKVCNKTFRHFEEWRLHRVLEHLEVDSMSCFYCDESFAERTIEGLEIRHDKKLVDHINNVHKIPGYCREFFGCELCGFVASTGKYKAKAKHLLRNHGIPLEEAYTCRICSKSFKVWQASIYHTSSTHFQSGHCICEICGQEFKRPVSLADHKINIHGVQPEEGIKVLSCPKEGCLYKSVQQGVINSHYQRNHQDSRPGKCPHCPKTFRFTTKLKAHIEIHLNKESKPYQCEICGNSFAVKNYLYIHKRLSHEKRTFPSTNKKKPPRKGSRKKQNPNSAITDDNSQQEPARMDAQKTVEDATTAT